MDDTLDITISPALLVCLVVLALLIIWLVPRLQARRLKQQPPTEYFNAINEARKTVATIVGGIVLLVGAWGTWRNIKIAQEGQITDRFTKATDQLGAFGSKGEPNLSIRVGGIYALQRIAIDSRRDHWPIIQILCSYVRTNAPRKRIERGGQPPIPIRPIGADVQAALTVLGVLNRDSPREEQLDLSQTDLRGADLTKGSFSTAFLNRADLRGAYLSNSDFNGAYLEEAEIAGADLSATDLTGAQGLTQQQIDETIGNTNTKLPAGLHMPDSWRK